MDIGHVFFFVFFFVLHQKCILINLQYLIQLFYCAKCLLNLHWLTTNPLLRTFSQDIILMSCQSLYKRIKIRFFSVILVYAWFTSVVFTILLELFDRKKSELCSIASLFLYSVCACVFNQIYDRVVEMNTTLYY